MLLLLVEDQLKLGGLNPRPSDHMDPQDGARKLCHLGPVLPNQWFWNQTNVTQTMTNLSLI